MKKIDTSKWTKHEIEQGFAIRRNEGGGYFALYLDGTTDRASRAIANKQSNKLIKAIVKQKMDMMTSNSKFDDSMKAGYHPSNIAFMQKGKAEADKQEGKISNKQAKYIKDMANGEISYSTLYESATQEDAITRGRKVELRQKIAAKVKRDNAKKQSYDNVLGNKLKTATEKELTQMGESNNKNIKRIVADEIRRRNMPKHKKAAQDYYKNVSTEWMLEDLKNRKMGLDHNSYPEELTEQYRNFFEGGREYAVDRLKQEAKSKKMTKASKDYRLYKQAKEHPEDIDPMTENSTDWEALEKKFGKRYEKERAKKGLSDRTDYDSWDDGIATDEEHGKRLEAYYTRKNAIAREEQGNTMTTWDADTANENKIERLKTDDVKQKLAKQQTTKQQINALNATYKQYLEYPIRSYRNRKWSDAGPGSGHGKGIKYETTYNTSIKNYDGKLGLDLYAKSLKELEEKIKKHIKK